MARRQNDGAPQKAQKFPVSSYSSILGEKNIFKLSKYLLGQRNDIQENGILENNILEHDTKMTLNKTTFNRLASNRRT
jgi:hypothetical protein